METTTLLRSILFQMLHSQDFDVSLHAVKAMCSKDDIAAVEKEIAELRQDQEKNRNQD
jgi:hypothetical protein